MDPFRDGFSTKMINKVISILFCILMFGAAISFAQTQRNSKRFIIAGCYSDLKEINEGIIGNGTIEIRKENGKYSGKFSQLSNELGLTFDATPLQNLEVNEKTGAIKLDIQFYVITNDFKWKPETVRGVTGKVTQKGIKMNWGGRSAEYGQPNPFMSREKYCTN
jgi:hypothetical protein